MRITDLNKYNSLAYVQQLYVLSYHLTANNDQVRLSLLHVGTKSTNSIRRRRITHNVTGIQLYYNIQAYSNSVIGCLSGFQCVMVTKVINNLYMVLTPEWVRLGVVRTIFKISIILTSNTLYPHTSLLYSYYKIKPNKTF